MLKVQTPNGEDKVLLHSCCAPLLCHHRVHAGKRHTPTVFYCNPNIYPQAEYEIRKEEAIRFVTSKPRFHRRGLRLCTLAAHYKGLENEPERGSRCLKCFTLRLTETARYASEHGFSVFTTTLASSRWKSLEQINEAGRRAAALYPDTLFWEQNWRKGGLQGGATN